MAFKVNNSTCDSNRECAYLRALPNDDHKKKIFVSRINFEKCLPFKKRLFQIELQQEKSRFRPTPYEKPVTRSQGRRSVGMHSNSANKENKEISTNDGKVRHTQFYSFLNKQTQ